MPATFRTDELPPRTASSYRRDGAPAKIHRRPVEQVSRIALDRAQPQRVRAAGVLRSGAWDALFIALAFVHAALLVTIPSIPLIAVGFWWNANTIAHNFIHRPFFHLRIANAIFSALLSLVLGVPQRLWRDRHLAHHAGKPWSWRWSRQSRVELAMVATLWAILAAVAPEFLLTTYLPGWLLGLGLCQLQGQFEHARGATSHYGRLYNLLFFNDGYHAEHHDRPAEHWTRLPGRRMPGAGTSRWPAVLRWLEVCSLDSLEHLVLRSPALQRFVLEAHERAFRKLLPHLSAVRRVGIVGGGMFPRTALILRRLLPHAELRVIDSNTAHLATAKRFLNGNVQYRHEFFDCSSRNDVDLIVIPLAFRGRRTAIYDHPPAPMVVVHDWIWKRRGRGTLISPLLLKRLNLITR